MNMKELRERSGKRPEDIASELGVAITTVRNWESLKNVPRTTPIGTIKLTQVYRCTLAELVQAEEEALERKFNPRVTA